MNLIKEEPQAVILAGGLGTRLKPITETIPKPMVKILGKPFLEYKINQVRNCGVKRIILCVGYLGNVIEDYFGDGNKFGVDLEYAHEKELLGTAGAIKNAEDLIDTDSFVVMNGDTHSNVNLKNLFIFHKTHNHPITMVVASATNPSEQELVEIDDNKIVVEFHKRDTPEHKAYLARDILRTINAGVYVFDRRILNSIARGEKVSLEKDIFPKFVKEIVGFEYGGYLKDLANIQFCEELKKDLMEGNCNDS